MDGRLRWWRFKIGRNGSFVCNHIGVCMDMMGYMLVVSYFLYVLYFKNWCNICITFNHGRCVLSVKGNWGRFMRLWMKRVERWWCWRHFGNLVIWSVLFDWTWLCFQPNILGLASRIWEGMYDVHSHDRGCGEYEVGEEWVLWCQTAKKAVSGNKLN